METYLKVLPIELENIIIDYAKQMQIVEEIEIKLKHNLHQIKIDVIKEEIISCHLAEFGDLDNLVFDEVLISIDAKNECYCFIEKILLNFIIEVYNETRHYIQFRNCGEWLISIETYKNEEKIQNILDNVNELYNSDIDGNIDYSNILYEEWSGEIWFSKNHIESKCKCKNQSLHVEMKNKS